MNETGCLGVIVETPARQARRIIARLRDEAHDDLELMALAIQRGGTPQEMRLMLDAHRVLEAEYDGLKKALQRARDMDRQTKEGTSE